MTSKKNKGKMTLVLVVLVLAVLACAELEVENKSDIPVRINVRMPGGNSTNYLLLEGKETEYFVSEFSGTYSVSMIADDSYRDMLTLVRDGLIKAFQDKSGNVSSTEIDKIVKDIEEVNTSLNNIRSVSCSGTLSRDGYAFAEIEFDSNDGDWSIQCIDD